MSPVGSRRAAASAWVSGPLTSLAITQLLLAVDLRRIWPEAQRLFGPFVVALLSTLLAVLLGAVLLKPWLQDNSTLLAGIYTATFTGGSLKLCVPSPGLCSRRSRCS